MIVYFAGVNQIHFCERFADRHVLETFTDSRPLYGRYRATFASMALDCGAYSAMRAGTKIDLGEYAAFCLEHGDFYEWVASVDVIDGGPRDNVRNWQALLAAGVDAMPTVHQGEPMSLIREYCSGSPRIGLGFQRDANGQLASGSRAFLDEAFSHIPPHISVHGWAMTNYTAHYPFASVDSTSWLYELKALRSVQTTQQGEPFSHLTDSELIEIIQKRYDRLPKMKKWQARPFAKQLGLLKETA